MARLVAGSLALFLALGLACGSDAVAGGGTGGDGAPGGSGGSGGEEGSSGGSGGSGGGSGGSGGSGGGGGGSGGGAPGWTVEARVNLCLAITRVYVGAEDPDASRCLDVTFSQGATGRLPSLQVPSGWGVERALFYPGSCSAMLESDVRPVLDAEGTVTFPAIDEETGAPTRLAIEAVFSFDPETGTEEIRLDSHDVPVVQDCW